MQNAHSCQLQMLFSNANDVVDLEEKTQQHAANTAAVARQKAVEEELLRVAHMYGVSVQAIREVSRSAEWVNACMHKCTNAQIY